MLKLACDRRASVDRYQFACPPLVHCGQDRLVSLITPHRVERALARPECGAILRESRGALIGDREGTIQNRQVWQLGVDGAVEHGQIAHSLATFSRWRIAQMCLGFSGASGTDQAPPCSMDVFA